MAARYGSGADLARELGITRQAVSKAEASGRISRSANGQFDLDAAAIQYRLHTDPEQQMRSLQQRGAQVEVLDRAVAATFAGTTALPAAADASLPAYLPDAAGRLMVAKARREQAEAELAEIKLQEAHGTLVHAADVKRAVFTLSRTVRDQVLAVPDRLAALLAAEPDAAACRRVLDTELRQALAALASLPPELAGPASDPAPDPADPA